MGASEKFEVGKQYHLIIEYTLADGYTLADEPEIIHDLPGGAAGHNSAAKKILVTYTIPETYNVTVTTDGHGTASASPAAAAKGATVTLTATPTRHSSWMQIPMHPCTKRKI